MRKRRWENGRRNQGRLDHFNSHVGLTVGNGLIVWLKLKYGKEKRENMFIHTGRLMSTLADKMPVMTNAQRVNFLIETMQTDGKKGAYRDKFNSGEYIMLGNQNIDRIKELLFKLNCSASDVGSIILPKINNNDLIAAEKGGKIVTMQYGDYAAPRRKVAEKLNALRQDDTPGNTDKAIELLAEIATLLHGLNLKIDNTGRLLMKAQEQRQEIIDLWKGGEIDGDNTRHSI